MDPFPRTHVWNGLGRQNRHHNERADDDETVKKALAHEFRHIDSTFTAGSPTRERQISDAAMGRHARRAENRTQPKEAHPS